MSEQFTISVPWTKAGATMLVAAATALSVHVGGAPAATLHSTPAAPAAEPVKGKPGRKPKDPNAAAPAAPVQGATAATPEDDGLGLGDADSGDELGLDDVAPPAKPLTLAGDVIPAFRAALERVGGDKGKLAKVLEIYGVKSVQLLPEAKWSEVVAKLSTLK